MKKFPSNLNLKNKENFKKIYNRRLKCYLRRSIYEHIIKNEENNYFSIDEFKNEKKVEDSEIIKEIISELIVELNRLGWKCKLAFGGTGLFIYSGENPPSNCWESDL